MFLFFLQVLRKKAKSFKNLGIWGQILFKGEGEVVLLRFAHDPEEYGKAEHMASLEGKKMFLYLAPKKAGVAKKSQQALDREKKANEQKEGPKQQTADTEIDTDMPANGGLFANAKISAAAKEKLNIKD